MLRFFLCWGFFPRLQKKVCPFNENSYFFSWKKSQIFIWKFYLCTIIIHIKRKYKPSFSEHLKNYRSSSYFCNKIHYLGTHLEKGREIITQNNHWYFTWQLQYIWLLFLSSLIPLAKVTFNVKLALRFVGLNLAKFYWFHCLIFCLLTSIDILFS